MVQQGRLAEAETEVLNELQQHPSNANAYNLLGVIDSEKKDYASALTAFQKALQLAPNSAEIHSNLGNAYLTAKNFDLAEKQFRTVLRLEPGNPNGNFNLGVLLLAKGLPAEAIPYFLRVRPQTDATRINLVRAYLRAKRPAEATTLAAELSREYASDIQVHITLGLLLASEGQYKPAEIELEKADVLKPEDFDILYYMGQTYLRDGQLTEAELQLNSALRLKPDSPETLYLLAQTCNNQSRPLDALDLLARAHRLAPQNTDIVLLMAQIAISQRYFEDAIPLLETGLQIAPQRTDLRSELGESYFKSDKVDKAIEEFDKVVADEPSAHAYAYLGLSHIYLGRFDDARQDFQNGLKLEPHNNFCLFNLGYIAERQGNSAEAETIFEKVLIVDPGFPDALLELANLRIQARNYSEAAELLRRYIRVSKNPASGYYKLALVERSLHRTEAADRDLAQFQALSKSGPATSYLYDSLFEYLDKRSKLEAPAREQLDLAEVIDQNKKHPDQPEILYLLAAAYLKSGQMDEARSTIDQLDKATATDYRALTGTGVLLARYRLYSDAISHFQAALGIQPGTDDIEFDLADAYFRKGQYPQALDAARQVSTQGQKDDAYLSLLGDIYAHLGDSARAEEIFRAAILRNPDNDQDYLSLGLLGLRENNIAEAKQVLSKGQARIPASGKILWGLGLVSALEGNTAEASIQLERAVDLLPEWPGSYSTLGVFYFETGQVAKAKEVLERFKNSSAGGLDVNRIEQVLSQAPQTSSSANEPLAMADRKRLLQFALTLADRTL
ncbi:MAG: tetratricopeptide repeat protein [Terracidiphilus sp.]